MHARCTCTAVHSCPTCTNELLLFVKPGKSWRAMRRLPWVRGWWQSQHGGSKHWSFHMLCKPTGPGLVDRTQLQRSRSESLRLARLMRLECCMHGAMMRILSWAAFSVCLETSAKKCCWKVLESHVYRCFHLYVTGLHATWAWLGICMCWVTSLPLIVAGMTPRMHTPAFCTAYTVTAPCHVTSKLCCHKIVSASSHISADVV